MQLVRGYGKSSGAFAFALIFLVLFASKAKRTFMDQKVKGFIRNIMNFASMDGQTKSRHADEILQKGLLWIVQMKRAGPDVKIAFFGRDAINHSA